MNLRTTRSILSAGRPAVLALALLAGGAATLAPVGGPAVAGPEPSPIPLRWQLDFRPGPLRVITLDVPDQGLRSFFYMTYTVVNNTGEDLVFAPIFELSTDAGELIRSGRNVPDWVVGELLRRLNNPLLEDEIAIIRGSFQQGEENARKGLVVWTAGSLTVDDVTVYASGFSGETRIVQRPDTKEDVVLRKVMMLKHATPGDISGRGSEPLDRVEQRWILR